MLLRPVVFTLCAAFAVVLSSGCEPKKSELPVDAKVPPTEQPMGATATAATTDATAKDDGKVETQPADTAVAATEIKTEKVLLGSPDLTAGIPGTGDLTMEQLTAWLNDPKNHAILEVELPLGLSAGAGSEKGLIENPLTRAKIELGRQLYFDTRLSGDGSVSCASCHHPDHAYAKETQFGVGVRSQTGNRNSPVAYNRILSDKQFWDGRAKSLEDQATGPIANAIEMSNTHEACVICLNGIPEYRVQFEKIFGELTIDSVGKALASFERALVTGPTAFDYYEQFRPFMGLDESDFDGEPEQLGQFRAAEEGAARHPMSESAIRGRELFFGKANCTSCHVGANLADELYHNIGVGMDAKEPDLGRYVVSMEEKDKGAFKTPTIRNVAKSHPYMHDGSQKTLEEVVERSNKGGHPNPHLSEKIKPLNLNDQEKKDLVEFMKDCTGDFPMVEQGRLPAK